MASGLSPTPGVTTCLLPFFIGSAAKSVATAFSPMTRRQHQSATEAFSHTRRCSLHLSVMKLSARGMLHSLSSTMSSPHLTQPWNRPSVSSPLSTSDTGICSSNAILKQAQSVWGLHPPQVSVLSNRLLSLPECTAVHIPFLGGGQSPFFSLSSFPQLLLYLTA